MGRKKKQANPAYSVVELPLASIRPGRNDRRTFKEGPLLELATSIAEHGLAQPITVRPVEPGDDGSRYEIVAGERRWRAHKLYTGQVAGGEWAVSAKVLPGTIKAIVRHLSDEEADGIMLAENVHREDLDPIEEAQAYRARIDRHDWTLARIARTAKVGPERVRNRLKLLALDPELQELVSRGQLRIPFAEEMSVLNVDHQRLVLQWLNRQSYIPTRRHVAEYVGKLQAQEMQGQMFSDMFCEKAVKAAEDEALRVSDMLSPLAHLPPLPVTRGPAGTLIDAYLARLIEDGFRDEAAVVADLWRKLMKCNRAQVKPWDSRALPLL